MPDPADRGWNPLPPPTESAQIPAKLREKLVQLLMQRSGFSLPFGGVGSGPAPMLEPPLRMMGTPASVGAPIFPPSRGPSLLMAPELYSSGQGGLPELRGRRYP